MGVRRITKECTNSGVTGAYDGAQALLIREVGENWSKLTAASPLVVPRSVARGSSMHFGFESTVLKTERG